jgi:hypothetical protein
MIFSIPQGKNRGKKGTKRGLTKKTGYGIMTPRKRMETSSLSEPIRESGKG